VSVGLTHAADGLDAVAPGVLGAVQRAVGLAQQQRGFAGVVG
jgi:hypothetical protein